MKNSVFAVILLCSIITVVSCSAVKNATNGLSYTTDVKPIIDANCATSCHNASRPAGGIDLTTYEKVKANCISGKLIDAIQHNEGAKPMPKKAPKLDNASIQIIINWTVTGAAM
jgi:hypothetical protein